MVTTENVLDRKPTAFPGKFGTAGLFCHPLYRPEPREDISLALPKARRGSLADKHSFFSKRVVMVPAFENAWNKTRFLIEQAKHTDKAGGLLIIAEGGCGKTFLSEQLAIDFPLYDSTYELLVPVVFVTLQSGQDEKDVSVEILLQLGEAVRKNDFTAQDLRHKVVEALRRVRCQCIYVDEAQRLDTISTNRRKDDRKLGAVGELLKTLYDFGGVAIILAGTPPLEALVNSDRQFKSRWSAAVRLEPFQADAQFQGVLNQLGKLIPLEEESDFAGPGVAAALWVATNGNFRELKTFLKAALTVAFKDQAKRIELVHLRDAYRLNGDFSLANPFDVLIKHR